MFGRDPRSKTWHRLKESREWGSVEKAIGHPDDDYFTTCGQLLVKKADGCASQTGDEAVLAKRLPRAARRCGNCFRG